MNEFYTRNVLEAALLAAGKPLTVAELGQLFDENTRPKVEDIRATLDALAAEYSNRGLEVKETAAGFRIQVRREFASEISRLWPERRDGAEPFGTHLPRALARRARVSAQRR